MNRLLPNARYEQKFVVEKRTVADVLSLVRRHPASFHETFRERIVNNIYLDTPGLNDFQAHVNGLAHRVKNRIRWYGRATPQIDHPAYERKLRDGRITGKITHRLAGFRLDRNRVPNCLKQSLASSQLPEVLQEALRRCEPVLFNRYRRHYFASADGRFRLTVDSELRFGEIGQAALPDQQLSSPSDFLVLELKYLPQHAEPAARVSASLPFPMSRCSKYVLGIQRIRL